MSIIEIEFNEDIRWRIDQSDPRLLNLQSLPGWAFINPLVYPSILSDGFASALPSRSGCQWRTPH